MGRQEPVDGLAVRFAGLRGSPKRVLDRLEVRRDFAMQALPCHGEFDTAGTALEQLDVESLLQNAHLVTERAHS